MPRIKAGSASGGVGIDDLNKLNRDLKAISKEAQGELKEANIALSKKEAERARSAAFSLGGVAAHVAPGISGGGGNAWAGIRLGTDPAAAGAEFGGRGKPTTQQFQPHLGTVGYFVFPTIRRDSEDIERGYTEAIDDLIRKHNL